MISASDWCPASAQPAMMGAIPMMWMRAVWGSRERCRGAWWLPLSMTSSQISSWALIGSGSWPVLAAKYRSASGGAVVVQQAGGGEDLEGGGDVAAIAGQLQHVGGVDLRARRVLEDVQEPQRAARRRCACRLLHPCRAACSAHDLACNS